MSPHSFSTLALFGAVSRSSVPNAVVFEPHAKKACFESGGTNAALAALSSNPRMAVTLGGGGASALLEQAAPINATRPSPAPARRQGTRRWGAISREDYSVASPLVQFPEAGTSTWSERGRMVTSSP